MEKAHLEAWKSALMGETLIFNMLGKALHQDPDRDWLDALIRESVFSEVPFGENQPETQKGLELLSEWTERNSGGISEQEFEAIKKDHLYLFIGASTPLAPVWESVYFSESKLLFQKETLEVRDWYRRFGLEVERKGRIPDDQIGLELGFIGHLAMLALAALETGDHAAFEENLQAQREFLTEHLLRWGPNWANLVEQHAETLFYRGLARLTLGSLLAATELLDIVVPQEG